MFLLPANSSKYCNGDIPMSKDEGQGEVNLKGKRSGIVLENEAVNRLRLKSAVEALELTASQTRILY